MEEHLLTSKAFFAGHPLIFWVRNGTSRFFLVQEGGINASSVSWRNAFFCGSNWAKGVAAGTLVTPEPSDQHRSWSRQRWLVWSSAQRCWSFNGSFCWSYPWLLGFGGWFSGCLRKKSRPTWLRSWWSVRWMVLKGLLCKIQRKTVDTHTDTRITGLIWDTHVYPWHGVRSKVHVSALRHIDGLSIFQCLHFLTAVTQWCFFLPVFHFQRCSLRGSGHRDEATHYSHLGGRYGLVGSRCLGDDGLRCMTPLACVNTPKQAAFFCVFLVKLVVLHDWKAYNYWDSHFLEHLFWVQTWKRWVFGKRGPTGKHHPSSGSGLITISTG